MFNHCSVPNCKSLRQDVKLHVFPNSIIRYQKWLECINCDILRSLSVSELSKRFVCHKHFEARFVTPKSRLLAIAYPTLFSNEEISSGIPAQHFEDTENFNPFIDHDYCKTEHVDHNYCKKSISFIGENSRSSCTISQEPLHDINQESSASIRSGISNVGMLQTTTTTPNISTPKKGKKCMVQKTALLTPNCRKLYKEYNKAKRKLDFCKKTKKCAISYSKERSFEKMTKGITELGKKLMWMQVKQSKKKSKGRRFNQEEKLICLSILKQSPKCYKFLQKIFILPSKVTLNKFVSDLKMDAGIYSLIFQAISREVCAWDENRKFCCILFDEVALEPGLTYNKYKDVIEGFVELDSRTNDFADHALVFMLRGAIHKWQQPIAYYFCKGQTPAIHLKNIIKNIVAAVVDTGLKPVALVSDQGASFQSALRNLQEESKREQILLEEFVDDVIIIGQCRLSVIYDPPHLIKGLRNNFLSNNIKFDGKISKWSDIVEIYKTDCKHANSRLLHKLNDEHVIPEKVKKMKVKNCARVFSKTVAAALAYSSEFSFYSDGTPVSPTLRNTSEVTTFFDDLFDSVNGVSFDALKKGKQLRSVVTNKSSHHQFWHEAIRKLSNMRYVDDKGKEKLVPTQKNWVVTLKSFERLWQFFKQKNIKIMRPRYFNSDPIENFFGQPRAYNYRNNNPDCHSFKNTFRSLLITRFIRFHSNAFNCEEDSAEQLLKLKSLFTNLNITENDVAESSYIKDFNPENLHTTASQERLNVHSHAYTTGWVIRKILKNLNCTTCESNLTTIEISSAHKWISLREYNSVKNKLTYPSEQAIRLFKYISQQAIEYLENSPEKIYKIILKK